MLTKSLNKLLYKIASNKKQLHKLRHLLKLPYNQLLDQLISTYRKKQRNDIDKSWILRLSAQHDCPKLLQIYIKLKSNTKNKEKEDLLNDQWCNLTENGMKQIFQIIQQSSSAQNNQIFNYLSMVKMNMTTNQSMKNLFQTLSTGIPYFYPIQNLSFEDKIWMKQAYIQSLAYTLSYVYQNNASSSFGQGFDITKLLPIELFNISDQALVEDIYFKYIYPNLKYNSIEQIKSSVSELGRFGLPCNSYLIRALSYIKQSISRSKQDSKQEQKINCLQISNILYIIHYKILKNASQSNKQSSKQIVKTIIEIVRNFSLTQLLSKDQNEFISILQQIYKTFKFNLQTKKEKNNKKIKQLFNIWSILSKQTTESNNNIDVYVHIYVVRYLLLLFYCSVLDKSMISNTAIKQLFNHNIVVESLGNILSLGDILAELIYVKDLYEKIYQIELFKSDNIIKKKINNMREQYKKTIKQIQINQDKIKFKYSINRSHNVEYLLSNSTQLAFNPASALNTAKESISEQKIMISLVNDTQFIGSQVGGALGEVLKDRILKNLKLNIENISIGEQYPYLPAFKVSDFSKKYKQIYVKTNFCTHFRIKQKNAFIFDTLNPQSMQKTITEFSNKKYFG